MENNIESITITETVDLYDGAEVMRLWDAGLPLDSAKVIGTMDIIETVGILSDDEVAELLKL